MNAVSEALEPSSNFLITARTDGFSHSRSLPPTSLSRESEVKPLLALSCKVQGRVWGARPR